MEIGSAPRNYNISKTAMTVNDATISSKDGVLTIKAGAKDADIKVSEDSRGLHVTVGDKVLHFKKGEYPKGIDVQGGAGNDKIHIDSGIKVPVRVDGGAGDDFIHNRNQGTVIDGGVSGKDHVENFGGNDAKIRVGHGSKVDNYLSRGTQIEAGDDATIKNQSDDSFVRVGKRVDLFNYGSRNRYEVGGMFKKFQIIGSDNSWVYPNENPHLKKG